MPHHIYLSPHFDDAVFSCGGQIYQIACSGQRVTVYTVMAGFPPPHFKPTPFTDELHARWALGNDPEAVITARQAEDRAAISMLGADVRFGTIPDSVYRVSADGEAFYPAVEAIFSPVNPHDTANLAMLEADFCRNFANVLPFDPNETILYIPLGVGKHVDHLLTRALGAHLAAQFRLRNAYFYEEYPYARKGRQKILEAVVDLHQVLEPYRSHFGLRVTSQKVVIDEVALRQKIAASACYVSQVSTFWENTAALEADLRSYQTLSGGEGCWRPLLRHESDSL
ncbi:MAG: hypothetical protein OHK0023_09950 [Anaerolineae bacterium]